MRMREPKPFWINTETSTVEYGFVILDSRRRVWGDMIFADEDAANMTAARCVADAKIVAARKIFYIDYPPSAPRDGQKRIQFLLDED